MTGVTPTATEMKVVAVETVAEGISLLFEVADTSSELPMLVVPAIDPGRPDLGLLDGDLVALAAAMGAEEPATLAGSGWRGGPVLAVGLDGEAVAVIADEGRVSAVIRLATS